MRRRLRHRHTPVDLNVIPLIDVVFFLLVFYVITTSFVQESAVPLERPGSDHAAPVAGSYLTVAVPVTGDLLLGDQPQTLGSLPAAIAAARQAALTDRVLVVPDRSIPTGRLLAVIDACRHGGATQVQVAAQAEGP